MPNINIIVCKWWNSWMSQYHDHHDHHQHHHHYIIIIISSSSSSLWSKVKLDSSYHIIYLSSFVGWLYIVHPQIDKHIGSMYCLACIADQVTTTLQSESHALPQNMLVQSFIRLVNTQIVSILWRQMMVHNHHHPMHAEITFYLLTPNPQPQ